MYSNFVLMVQLSQSHCALRPTMKIRLKVSPKPYNINLPKWGCCRTEEECPVPMRLTSCLIWKVLSLLKPARSSWDLGKVPPKIHALFSVINPGFPKVRHQHLCHCLHRTFWFYSSLSIIECCVCIYVQACVNFFSWPSVG